jgi:hypothetical protein
MGVDHPGGVLEGLVIAEEERSVRELHRIHI